VLVEPQIEFAIEGAVMYLGRHGCQAGFETGLRLCHVIG
jgi:hypothetical protein